MPLLPGSPYGPSPLASSTAPRRASRIVRVLLFGWLLAVLAYAAIHLTASKQQSPPDQQSTRSATSLTTSEPKEDLLREVDAVMDRTAVGTASLRRAEDQIRRAVPVVERNTLIVETRRLETALAVIEAARRDLEQERENLVLIHNQLEKENPK